MSLRPVGWTVVLLAAWPLTEAAARAQKPPAVADLLKVAGDAVTRYAQHLGAVAADEEFTQYETSSGRMSTPKRINSVVLLVGQSDGTIANFRDLVGIDTVPVRPKDDRLITLFRNPNEASMGSAQALSDEAVKAYYSPNLHLLDRPTLAFELLRTENQPNSTYKIEGMKNMDGTPVAVLKFNEKATGRLMPGAPAIGRCWIEPDTGIVHQTELGFVSPAANIHATVKFTKDPQLNLFVPSELFEQVEASSAGVGVSDMGGGGGFGSRQAMEGRARYSAYRRVSGPQ
jgi:hypothetical protein